MKDGGNAFGFIYKIAPILLKPSINFNIGPSVQILIQGTPRAKISK